MIPIERAKQIIREETAKRTYAAGFVLYQTLAGEWRLGDCVSAEYSWPARLETEQALREQIAALRDY